MSTETEIDADSDYSSPYQPNYCCLRVGSRIFQVVLGCLTLTIVVIATITITGVFPSIYWENTDGVATFRNRSR